MLHSARKAVFNKYLTPSTILHSAVKHAGSEKSMIEVCEET